ncbi:MAG: GGDEF domain-containing protein [Treponema sp.]|uniref:GGDEF domain-containing protein n=1 Tax=Treponema sp. TaxID=166 RepID=UPI0025D6AD37|nr:GGDEF domain-containing protein [Treponema sp.]MBQ8678861.1 GGDEF domain-containing protein [Treponema sp.]
MKKIALLVQDLDSDYFTFMVDGAKRYCQKYGHQLFVFIIRGKNWSHGSFDYQFYAACKLLTKKNIDGILLATNTYCQNAPESKRAPLVKEFSYVPLVSIGAHIPDVFSVISDNKAAFKELLRHLADVHGKKNIVLMLPLSTSVDIILRRQAYEEFLQERGIALDDSKIIYADYTYEDSRESLSHLCPKKEDVYFDAIVTCSDDLAFGCIAYLRELGVSVPEEVAVTGFDNQKRCLYSNPELTSIDQQISLQAFQAGEFLEKQFKNPASQAEICSVPSIVFYRESCGCSKSQNLEEMKNKFDTEELILHRKEVIAHFHFFLQEMQASLSLTEFKLLLIRNLRDYGIHSCVICLYDDPIYYGKNDDFELPDSAKVLIAFSGHNYYENLESAVTNPRKQMIPEGFSFEEGKSVVVSSLFNTSFQYGYVAYTPGAIEPRMYELIFSATGIALASNRLLSLKDKETKKLADANQNLKAASVTDSLTGVFNRGGFMKYAERIIKNAREKKESGAVIYGDMDHLKKINDELGHDMGDAAIVAEVSVLKKVFRDSDIIGRMGGDEFAIVAPNLNESGFLQLCARLESESESYNKSSNAPFTLSISLGMVSFDSENYDLATLLKKADERQYEQKRAHHKARS